MFKAMILKGLECATADLPTWECTCCRRVRLVCSYTSQLLPEVKVLVECLPSRNVRGQSMPCATFMDGMKNGKAWLRCM
jgi:hypothetical protein